MPADPHLHWYINLIESKNSELSAQIKRDLAEMYLVSKEGREKWCTAWCSAINNSMMFHAGVVEVGSSSPNWASTLESLRSSIFGSENLLSIFPIEERFEPYVFRLRYILDSLSRLYEQALGTPFVPVEPRPDYLTRFDRILEQLTK